MTTNKFKIKYEFINSVWTNEEMTIEAQTRGQALEKCKKRTKYGIWERNFKGCQI